MFFTQEKMMELIEDLQNGKEQSVLELLEKINPRKLIDEDLWKYYSLFISALIFLNKREAALQAADVFTTNAEALKKKEILLEATISKALALIHYTDQVNEAEKLTKDAWSLFRKLVINNDYFHSYFIVRLKLLKCLLSWNDLEIATVLDYLQDIMKLSRQFNWKRKEARALNILGVASSRRWKFSESIKYYRESLHLLKEIGAVSLIKTVKMNLGWSYRWLEDYEAAISCCEDVLELLQKDMFEKNDRTKAYILHILIRTFVELSDKTKIEEYFQQLKRLKENTDLKDIEFLYNFSNAIILKNSKRMVNIVKSQEILRELLEEDIQTNLIDQVAIMSEVAYSFCEILIEEFRSFGSEEVLEELEQMIQQLYAFSQKHKAYELKAQCMFLEGTIAFIKLELNKARDLFNEARIFAESKGLDKLAIKASNEYDALLEQITDWQKYLDQSFSLEERFKSVNFKERFLDFMDKKIEDVKIIPEKPTFVMILSKNGSTIYFYKFSQKITIDEQLLGGFISVIVDFLKAAFHTSKSLERIKHKEYTILVKELDSFIYSYVFQGRSYSALNKIDQFIDAIINNSKYEKLKEQAKTGKRLLNSQIFDQVVEKIFLE
ncbi:MAG: hypothetical protein GF308_15810 [Candidatus Heimdallarchaeota archaeon]|nr:hypothetical protein [Candidatus Heimdallarchaeota archaeon]